MPNNAELKKYRQAPHNIEAEQGLLGAILINNRALDNVGDLLQPHHFYTSAHQRIFEAIRKLIDRGQAASPVTLKNFFDNDEDLEKVGGGEYLADLAASVVTTFNAPDYARTIYDLHLRRELAAYAEETTDQAYGQNLERTALEIIEAAEERLYKIADTNNSSPEAAPIIEGCETALNATKKAMDGEAPHVKTGMAALDEKIGGFFPRELYIIAGRPAMGKTAFGLCLAENAAKAGHKALYFSLEMPRDQLAMRSMARATGVSTELQRRGEITDSQYRDLQKSCRDFTSLPLYIDDQAGLNIAQIRARMRRHIRKQGADLVIVDYLGLIRATNPNIKRTYQIEEITTGLKNAAKDFGVPVILLAQINRGVESRDDKRPTLSDLKDSGSIEQDADAVLTLYRHAYYLQAERPTRKHGEHQLDYEGRLAKWHVELADHENNAEIIIAKMRQGQTGTVILPFDPVRQVFGEIEQGQLITEIASPMGAI